MLEENREVFDYVNITKYHDKGYKGQNRKIVVVDTNFDETNPIFHGKVKKPLGDDRHMNNSHGFYVCQVLHQIAPEAEINLIGDWTEAVKWAGKNKATAVNISRSWGTIHHNTEFIYWSRKCAEQGTLLITSAGNDGERWVLHPPGRLQWWIAVGALQRNQSGDYSLASYSSYSREIQDEIWEMVEVVNFSNIWVHVLSNESKLWSPSGTSFSCPVQCGMAVLATHDYKFDSMQEYREFMYKNSSPLMNDLEFCRKHGFGLHKLPELVDGVTMIALNGEVVRGVYPHMVETMLKDGWKLLD